MVCLGEGGEEAGRREGEGRGRLVGIVGKTEFNVVFVIVVLFACVLLCRLPIAALLVMLTLPFCFLFAACCLFACCLHCCLFDVCRLLLVACIA